MDTIRVLHVDDEPSFGDLVSEFLQMEDDRFEVVTETSADDGISRIGSDQESIDCIISDYDMPAKDGLEFLEDIRDNYPNLPFILYTGKGSEEVASEAMSKGATDYLQKGSGTEQYELLANRVRNAVEQYRSQRRAAEHERITRVMRDLNRALVYADSVDKIEQEVCNVLTSANPYLTACIAGVNTETMQIEPRTWAGEAKGYFEKLDMSVDEGSPGRQAPGGRAFHERKIAISQNISADPQYKEWHEAATQRGFQSLAVVPLEYEDDLYGLLAVFADRRFAFDDTEQTLLAELGNDIAHALHAQEMQSELRKTASRLEALFERSPDMINVHDTQGNILEPNPQVCEKTGYDKTELTEMKVWDLNRTVDHDEAEALWEGMEIGDSQRLEGEYWRADGSSFPVEVHVRRLDLEGEDRFIAISRDISDRKERQTELERYERIIENLPVGVFRTTPDGDLIDMNEQYMSLLGAQAKADLADVDAEDFWADPADREALLRQLEQEGVVEVQEVEVKTLSGESKWVETTLRITEEGDNQYLDGVVWDITERRDRRRRLDQAETMFENAQDAMFLIDINEEFTIERVNPAYEEATGFSADELYGRTPQDILGDEQGAEIEQKYHECVEQRTPLEYKETLSINGTQTYWETRIAPVVVDDEIEKIVGATRDITDRKERETELHQTTARLEALFENSPDMINVHDSDGNIIDPNPRLCEQTGYDEEELRDMKVWELDQRIDPEEARALWKGMDPGDQERLEGVYQRRDGSTFPVEVHVRRLSVAGETRFMVISRDITERKRHAQKRQQIIDQMNDAVIEVDPEWRITLINERTEELAGVDESELLGQDFWDVFSEARGTRFEEAYRRAMKTREPVSLVDYYAGVDEWFDIQVYPNDDGGLAFYFQIVTDHKEREQELERYQQIVEDLNDIATIIDPDGTITYVSPAVRRVLGYDPEELIGENGFGYQPPETSGAVAEAIERVVTNPDEPQTVQTRFRRADGSWCWIESTLRNRLDEEMIDGILVSSRDITDRIQRRQELQRQNERLDEFTSVVAHDLRNPLNVATTSLELVAEECESEHLKRLDRALDRMDDLIENLLLLAQEGEAVTDFDRVDLAAKAEDCWMTVETPNATLVTDTDRTIYADERRLTQMFENLVRNAVEHGDEDVTITIGDLESGFYIEDDGPGIPSENQDDVFEAGYSTSETGTGFGLNIVKQIVEAHNWEIRVTDSDGGGARFEITDVEFADE